jgi:hypothetical protein
LAFFFKICGMNNEELREFCLDHPGIAFCAPAMDDRAGGEQVQPDGMGALYPAIV